MEPSFWRDRWAEGKIGFHEGRPNALLEANVGHFDGAARVLVPMCGKTEDLAYLAGRGHTVIGVELVEDAVRAFFSEHGVTPTVTPRGELVEYRAGAITIFAGDVFATTPALVGAVDAIYDRAALVALPPDTRPRYVPHLRGLAAPGARLLQITFEYPDGARVGPPFSVTRDEVRRLYVGAAAITEHGGRRDPRVAADQPVFEYVLRITL